VKRLASEQSRASEVKDVEHDMRLDSLEQRVDRLETLSITLAENQSQAQLALTELSVSVKAQNELVTEAWRGIKRGAPILLGILLAALGLGNQTGVM